LVVEFTPHETHILFFDFVVGRFEMQLFHKPPEFLYLIGLRCVCGYVLIHL
jgi:hypothetical protein